MIKRLLPKIYSLKKIKIKTKKKINNKKTFKNKLIKTSLINR